ncbi:MAG: DUF4199 domain-containing protein [Saprospiraceae bacterium]|nr:DUF4199 domain-containing protein [Saprospiraceae bacterium]
MENHSIKNGLLSGSASIVFSLMLYLVNPEFMITWGSYLGIFIVIYFMRKAIIDTKKDENGHITLGQAFKVSWLTYILGTVISTFFLYIMINYIDQSLVDILKNVQIDTFEKTGNFLKMTEDMIQEQVSIMEDTNPFGPSAIALSLPLSFLFPGAIISIIMAAIMKKNHPQNEI